MSVVLLDANMPIGLRAALSDHVVHTAYEMGWNTFENGDLLTAAEQAGFATLITGDKRIRYQQNMRGRRLAVVELDTNSWTTIRQNLRLVVEAVGAVRAGEYVTVAFPRPRLKRRVHDPEGNQP